MGWNFFAFLLNRKRVKEDWKKKREKSAVFSCHIINFSLNNSRSTHTLAMISCATGSDDLLHARVCHFHFLLRIDVEHGEEHDNMSRSRNECSAVCSMSQSASTELVLVFISVSESIHAELTYLMNFNLHLLSPVCLCQLLLLLLLLI